MIAIPNIYTFILEFMVNHKLAVSSVMRRTLRCFTSNLIQCYIHFTQSPPCPNIQQGIFLSECNQSYKVAFICFGIRKLFLIAFTMPI